MKRLLVFGVSIAMLGGAGGCATGPDRNPDDPLEPLNRATFRLNDTLDRHIARPIASGYNKYTPSPIKAAIGNFFSNIGDISVMLNNFAQGRGADGLSDLMRISTNTVFGLGGLIDVATPAGLPKHNQDIGLTLGHWGVPAGPYLVLPLFGPSTFRDAAGFAEDQQLGVALLLGPPTLYAMWGVDFINTRARYLGATDLLETAALDKYSFTRDAYLARRRSRLEEGKEEALPSYDSETEPAAKPADDQ